jgi:hypothetical protein
MSPELTTLVRHTTNLILILSFLLILRVGSELVRIFLQIRSYFSMQSALQTLEKVLNSPYERKK